MFEEDKYGSIGFNGKQVLFTNVLFAGKYDDDWTNFLGKLRAAGYSLSFVDCGQHIVDN